jgi:hypothetical protein
VDEAIATLKERGQAPASDPDDDDESSINIAVAPNDDFVADGGGYDYDDHEGGAGGAVAVGELVPVNLMFAHADLYWMMINSTSARANFASAMWEWLVQHPTLDTTRIGTVFNFGFADLTRTGSTTEFMLTVQLNPESAERLRQLVEMEVCILEFDGYDVCTALRDLSKIFYAYKSMVSAVTSYGPAVTGGQWVLDDGTRGTSVVTNSKSSLITLILVVCSVVLIVVAVVVFRGSSRGLSGLGAAAVAAAATKKMRPVATPNKQAGNDAAYMDITGSSFGGFDQANFSRLYESIDSFGNEEGGNDDGTYDNATEFQLDANGQLALLHNQTASPIYFSTVAGICKSTAHELDHSGYLTPTATLTGTPIQLTDKNGRGKANINNPFSRMHLAAANAQEDAGSDVLYEVAAPTQDGFELYDLACTPTVNGNSPQATTYDLAATPTFSGNSPQTTYALASPLRSTALPPKGGQIAEAGPYLGSPPSFVSSNRSHTLTSPAMVPHRTVRNMPKPPSSLRTATVRGSFRTLPIAPISAPALLNTSATQDQSFYFGASPGVNINEEGRVPLSWLDTNDDDLYLSIGAAVDRPTSTFGAFSDTDSPTTTTTKSNKASPKLMGFAGTPLSANQARRLTRSKSPPPFSPSTAPRERGWFGRDSEIMLKLRGSKASLGLISASGEGGGGVGARRPSSSKRSTTPV